MTEHAVAVSSLCLAGFNLAMFGVGLLMTWKSRKLNGRVKVLNDQCKTLLAELQDEIVFVGKMKLVAEGLKALHRELIESGQTHLHANRLAELLAPLLAESSSKLH